MGSGSEPDRGQQNLSLAAEEVAENPVNAGNWVLEGQADKIIAGSERSLTAATPWVQPARADGTHERDRRTDGREMAPVAGCQNQTTALAHLAKALRVVESEIIIHQCYVGGGFGRRLDVDYLVVAALSAKD